MDIIRYGQQLVVKNHILPSLKLAHPLDRAVVNQAIVRQGVEKQSKLLSGKSWNYLDMRSGFPALQFRR